MPMELALDFCALVLYDVIMYCDVSGSMAFEVRGLQDGCRMYAGSHALAMHGRRFAAGLDLK